MGDNRDVVFGRGIGGKGYLTTGGEVSRATQIGDRATQPNMTKAESHIPVHYFGM